MGKFIFLSFAFLGLVFYELSGGNDFDAEELRLSRLDPVAEGQLPTIKVAEAKVVQPVQSPAVQKPIVKVADKSATVTRASFDPNTLELTSQTTAPLDDAAGTNALDEKDTQTLILPSLITQNKVATVTTPPAVEDTPPAIVADIRAVTGNRVNMRGGPGTSYSVVGKLTRGAEVEILSDPGNGWVKLRPLDGGAEGWMADFLLTSG